MKEANVLCLGQGQNPEKCIYSYVNFGTWFVYTRGFILELDIFSKIITSLFL